VLKNVRWYMILQLNGIKYIHDPPAQWDQVYTLEKVVPAPVTIEQPPRKDP
nr:hypothetical protein [Tanacetum cinerariifolium]